MNDQKALAALNGRVQKALDAGVNSTPTFFVNGKKLAGHEIEDFDKAIAPVLKQ
jgi:protein-disulfide isomerase